MWNKREYVYPEADTGVQAGSGSLKSLNYYNILGFICKNYEEMSHQNCVIDIWVRYFVVNLWKHVIRSPMSRILRPTPCISSMLYWFFRFNLQSNSFLFRSKPIGFSSQFFEFFSLFDRVKNWFSVWVYLRAFFFLYVGNFFMLSNAWIAYRFPLSIPITALQLLTGEMSFSKLNWTKLIFAQPCHKNTWKG